MAFIGQKAPDFVAGAVLADGTIVPQFQLSKVLDKKYGILVFYPLDFTFVCPTELLSLNKRKEKFDALGAEVIAISVDSVHTHAAWRNTPVEKGGIGPVKYSLVSDLTHEIARAYDIEHNGVALRGTFVIDNKGIIRSEMINDLPIGRSIDEILRVVEAVQFHDTHGEVCPAGWAKGHAAMTASKEGVSAYLSQHAEAL